MGARIANFVGSPIERLVGPAAGARRGGDLGGGAQGDPRRAEAVAAHAGHARPARARRAAAGSNGWHKVASAASGAVGGAFGLAALAVELPVSTTIMMRSIADVARAEGADLADRQAQLECVMVLALGGGAPATTRPRSATSRCARR